MTSVADADAQAEADERPPASWQEQVRSTGWRVGVPATVAIVLLTAVTVGAGLLILRQPDAGIGALDLRVSRALVVHRTPMIDGWTGVGVTFANTVPVAVLWVAAMVVAGIVTRRWTIPIFLLVAVGGEKLTYLVAGLIVGRARPPVEPLGEVFAQSSFPSGHAGAAVTLYGGIAVAVLWSVGQRRGAPVGPTVRAVLGIAVAVIVAAVAFSRVWRGQHYPSDVVWGAALGLVWLVLAWWLVLSPAGRSDPSADLGPRRPLVGLRSRSS